MVQINTCLNFQRYIVLDKFAVSCLALQKVPDFDIFVLYGLSHLMSAGV